MNRNEISEPRTFARGTLPGRSGIRIWQVPLDLTPEVVLRLNAWLSPEEREQASRFHFSRDQRRFVVRRAARRQLLADSLGVGPHKVRTEPGRNGKPAVVGPVKFNCSHSGDWALIAISRNVELGVDLEQHRDLPDADDLAKNYFSHQEIRELMSLPAEQRRVAFFSCWTRKEAFLKAVGLGLSFDLNRFSVSLAPDQQARLLEVDGDPGAVEKWAIVSLEMIPGFSAALVHEAGTVEISRHQWQMAETGG